MRGVTKVKLTNESSSARYDSKVLVRCSRLESPDEEDSGIMMSAMVDIGTSGSVDCST
jgi:hypothetical protein